MVPPASRARSITASTSSAEATLCASVMPPQRASFVCDIGVCSPLSRWATSGAPPVRDGRTSRTRGATRARRAGIFRLERAWTGPFGRAGGGTGEEGNGSRLDADLLTAGEIELLMRRCSRRAPTGVRNRALIAVLWRCGLRPPDHSRRRNAAPLGGKRDVGSPRPTGRHPRRFAEGLPSAVGGTSSRPFFGPKLLGSESGSWFTESTTCLRPFVLESAQTS